MKNQDSNNDALSSVLKEWQAGTALPPGFQQSVWRRIDEKQRAPRHALKEMVHSWLTGFVSRPAMAAAYVSALMLVGLTLGWTQGQRDNARLQGELASHYVQSLDPYQAPRR